MNEAGMATQTTIFTALEARSFDHTHPLDSVIVALEEPACTCRWCRWWLTLLKRHLETMTGQEQQQGRAA